MSFPMSSVVVNDVLLLILVTTCVSMRVCQHVIVCLSVSLCASGDGVRLELCVVGVLLKKFLTVNGAVFRFYLSIYYLVVFLYGITAAMP
jgi:hypothetical protein